MTTTNRNLWLLVAAVLIVGIIAFAFVRGQSAPTTTGENASSTSPLATSTELTAEQIEQIKTEAIASLDIEAMVNRALKLKNEGNYDGAIAELNNAVRVFPNHIVAYNNLADIYLNYKKQYTKAELNYKKVIENDSRYMEAYRQLFFLYTTPTYIPNKVAAAKVVSDALKQNSGAYEFQLLLARYYKGLGEFTNARVQYEAAITNAKGQGLTSTAADMQAELNELPR